MAAPPEQRPGLLWGPISVVVPLLALLAGVLQLAAGSSGTGDFAGSLGGAVLLVLGLGIGCAIGLVAAVVALVRRERWAVLPWLSLVANGAVLLPILLLLLRN